MGEIYRSLYSVIPARVRDDHTLRPNAKLLYGELSALAQAEGYCWAWNARLAETLGISKRTVEDLLRQLRDRGHIRMEVERDPDSQEVLRRKIWICGPPGVSVPPPRDFTGRVPVKMEGPPRENGGENNTGNITAAKVLGYDLSNDVFRLPKDLNRKHDEATKAAAKIKDARKNAELRKKEAKRLHTLALRYTYTDGRWLIRPPLGAEEIVAEGKALRNCLGGYAERHVRGSTTILFLRDRTRPGHSLVAIEMNGNQIVQAHGWDDERTSCKDNPKQISPRTLYQKFLDGWLAWLEAGSRRDKRGYPILPKQTSTEVA